MDALEVSFGNTSIKLETSGSMVEVTVKDESGNSNVEIWYELDLKEQNRIYEWLKEHLTTCEVIWP